MALRLVVCCLRGAVVLRARIGGVVCAWSLVCCVCLWWRPVGTWWLLLCCACVWRWRGCAWLCCSSCAIDGVLCVRGWCCCAACAFLCILGKCPPVSMRSSIHPTRKANQGTHKHQLNPWTSCPAACFLLQPRSFPSRCRRASTPSSATPPVIDHLSAVVPRPTTAPQRPRRPVILPAPHISTSRQHSWPASTSPANCSPSARFTVSY